MVYNWQMETKKPEQTRLIGSGDTPSPEKRPQLPAGEKLPAEETLRRRAEEADVQSFFYRGEPMTGRLSVRKKMHLKRWSGVSKDWEV